MATETTLRRGPPKGPQTDVLTAVEFRQFVAASLNAAGKHLKLLVKASGLSLARLYAVASDENVDQSIGVGNATRILCAMLVEGLIDDVDQFLSWWKRLTAFLPAPKSLADYILDDCQSELSRQELGESRAKREAYRTGIEQSLRKFQLAESDDERTQRVSDHDRMSLHAALYAAKGRQTNWQ
jgi:hypothetical protein